MYKSFKNGNTETFLMRKIPTTKVVTLESEKDDDIAKIKILEISNFIDDWENEVLFSQNGFYSLKGKDVENKTKEFYSELNKLITYKITTMHFTNPAEKETVFEVKNKKLESIKNQMLLYETSQLNNWILEVLDKSLNCSIKRAVLYKNNPDIIMSSFTNGITILNLIKEREKWNSKVFESKKDLYESDFYSSIINSFIAEKDVNASLYYEKYKDKLTIENKESIEKSINNLKNNVIAYNWAKELFSYNLTADESEKEIQTVDDVEVRKLISVYFAEFKKNKKIAEDNDKKSKNQANWQEIISILNTEPDKADLYIDFSQTEQNIKLKKNYIKAMREKGYIKTDIKKFMELIKSYVENFEEFKKKDISDYYSYLSKEDYEFFENFQKQTVVQYEFFLSDYEYLENEFKSNKVNSEEKQYRILKNLLNSIKLYNLSSKQDPDIADRNRIIKALLERIKEEEAKKEQKKVAEKKVEKEGKEETKENAKEERSK